MTDHTREKAVHAADILNDLIGDLFSGTMLFRQWINQFQRGQIPAELMVTIQKICISHLVLALCKFREFYKRFRTVIPPKHLQTCKSLLHQIDQKGVLEFRNKCVGHIWDNDHQRPLKHSEIMKHLARLTDNDMQGFLNWINNPPTNEFPSTVISIVEIVRDALISEYSISPDEFLDR
jgi:hypothetical protein